jgi:hypothetical protein
LPSSSLSSEASWSFLYLRWDNLTSYSITSFSHQNWASNLTSRNSELKGNFRHFTIQFHEFQGPQWYKCWNHKFCVFSARKWQVQSHIYRVPPKRRLFSPVRTQVLTCPKMAVRKGREPRVRYWSRVYRTRGSTFSDGHFRTGEKFR